MYCEEICDIGDRCDKLKLLRESNIALKACNEMYSYYGKYHASPHGVKITRDWVNAFDTNTDAVLQCAKARIYDHPGK